MHKLIFQAVQRASADQEMKNQYDMIKEETYLVLKLVMMMGKTQNSNTKAHFKSTYFLEISVFLETTVCPRAGLWLLKIYALCGQ
jgi:hypothetical protein